MRIGEEMLVAVRDPFDRPAQPLRRHRGQRIFAIAEQLGAEAAAHIGCHHPHAVGRNPQHVIAKNVADGVAALAAERERQPPAGLIEFGNDAAGVEIIGRQPLIDHVERDRARRRREGPRGRAGIAETHLEGEIAGLLGPYRRRVRGERRRGTDRMGQRLPVDTDGLGRVLGMRERIGNHEGDGIADMADFIEREHRIGRNRDRRLGDQALARQVAEPGGVGTGQH